MPACAVGEPECSRAKLLADLDRVRPKRLELVVPMRSTNPDPVQNSDGRWLSTSGPVETVLHPTLARVDGSSNRWAGAQAAVGRSLSRGSWSSRPSIREAGETPVVACRVAR